jgi:hypothetical protein
MTAWACFPFVSSLKGLIGNICYLDSSSSGETDSASSQPAALIDMHLMVKREIDDINAEDLGRNDLHTHF